MMYNKQSLKDRRYIKAQNIDFRIFCKHMITFKVLKNANSEKMGLEQDDILNRYFYSLLLCIQWDERVRERERHRDIWN